MARRFYITTPIYYVNDVPHLGTAYTTIVADALRRYHKLRGDESRMLTGTDEHGVKLALVAEERGTSPLAFVEAMSERFRTAWPQLDVETDDFIRTTEPRHVEFVQELWRRVEANGDLYEGEYEDWYCVGCETFKTEKELLPGNLCPTHLKAVERVKEATYFFRLSKWEKPLLSLYERRPDFIDPAARRNEVVSFVEGGLKDLSVSRTSFLWGTPVPGNPKHVIWVWFDALANYLSALGPPESGLRRFWPPQGYAVHLVGKDILRFHAVYWPAFLLAAGYAEDELPSKVFAHGFLTVDGHKMSKTLRNAVDPLRLARELGADVLRYQLLRAIALGQDGDFDHAALLERYNADLGKNLGNLLSRVLGLCAKLTGATTPAMGAPSPLEEELSTVFDTAVRAAADAWEQIAPHRALEVTWTLASAANQYVDRAAPWAEAKRGNHERVGTTLAILLEVLRALSVMIWPAMPRKSAEMRAQLGLSPILPEVGQDVWPRFAPRAHGEPLAPGSALFPTYDREAQQALLEKLVPKPEEAPTTIRPPSMPVDSGDDEPPTTPLIDYATFANVALRVGVVRSCERVPKKDKLLRLMVDIGEGPPRQIVAGLALTFKPEDLVGKRVIVVSNLAPREFGKGLTSYGMLLATGPSDALALATVEGDVAPGALLR